MLCIRQEHTISFHLFIVNVCYPHLFVNVLMIERISRDRCRNIGRSMESTKLTHNERGEWFWLSSEFRSLSVYECAFWATHVVVYEAIFSWICPVLVVVLYIRLTQRFAESVISVAMRICTNPYTFIYSAIAASVIALPVFVTMGSSQRKYSHKSCGFWIVQTKWFRLVTRENDFASLNWRKDGKEKQYDQLPIHRKLKRNKKKFHNTLECRAFRLFVFWWMCKSMSNSVDVFGTRGI